MAKKPVTKKVIGKKTSLTNKMITTQPEILHASALFLSGYATLTRPTVKVIEYDEIVGRVSAA